MRVLAALFFVITSSSSASLLPVGSHCVAYKVSKRAALIFETEVVGKNCRIAAEIVPDPESKFHIEVRIPNDGFESGEAGRDRDVTRILGGDEYREMVFKSKMLTQKEWQEFLKADDVTLEGSLRIAQREHPVVFKVSLQKKENIWEADGVLQTSFKYFEIEPPSILGGLGVKVNDGLELHVHLVSSKMLNSEIVMTK